MSYTAYLRFLVYPFMRTRANTFEKGEAKDRELSKYLSFWGINFLVCGTLTAFVLMEPGLIWMGYWLFLIPGLILFIAPSWFFYSTAFTFLAFLLRPLARTRWVLALVLLALPALYVPYSGNQATWGQAQEFMKNDINVSSPIELSGSVALVNSVFPSHADRYHGNCLSLCQRLLYDSGVERVMVAVHRKVDDGDLIDSPANAELPAIAYFIEKRDVCPSGIAEPSTARKHIAPGDCLLSEEASMAEADLIYVTEEVTPTKRYALSARYDLDAIAVSANRKRVIKKAEWDYDTLYQRTEILAEPLVYPLVFSGIGHGGGSADMSLGFIRERVFLNDFRGFKRTEEPRIFGIRPHSPT